MAEAALHLVHDVLDAQLLDRKGEKIGRADEVVLEVRDGLPPRVTHILIGGAVRARRVGRWMQLLNAMVGALLPPKGSGVSRVSFAAVRRIGDTMTLDVEEAGLEAEQFERWLRESIVSRIPGSGGGAK